MRSWNNFYWRLGFVSVWFLMWWLAADFWLTATLPNPIEALNELVSILTSGMFYGELAVTARRVAGGFLLAFMLGFVVGVAMGLSRKAEAFFEIPVVLGVAAPGLFVAMIILIALGINEQAAMVAIAIISSPSIIVSFWQSSKSLDVDLAEMAQVFGLSRRKTLTAVILPQLLPAAWSSVRYGLGFAWKLIVVLELIGLSNGVGYQVNYEFSTFDMTGVIAWSLGFMLFTMLLEYVLIRPLERMSTRWRTAPTKRGSKLAAEGAHA